jgi:hypothetical protein
MVREVRAEKKKLCDIRPLLAYPAQAKRTDARLKEPQTYITYGQHVAALARSSLGSSRPQDLYHDLTLEQSTVQLLNLLKMQRRL